jgi:23S rRNA (adenine2503-C2)-methyltransferase
MIKKSLCGLTADEIFNLTQPCGFSYSQAVLTALAIYRKRISEISSIDKLSKKLKFSLNEIAGSGIFLPVASEKSADNTVKYLFRSPSGKEFETVYIPDNKRNTVCVSTQSGCRMGCSFCRTARYGFRGNLTTGEILNQILSIPDSEKVTHIVFMGMGEPMDNLDNVLKACEIITAEWGLSISSRNVTVSTVGIEGALEKFLRSSECNLTLSLHTLFSGERIKIVPAEKQYPVKSIIDLMKLYPLKKKRRLSVAYVMIEDINDTDNHLCELISAFKGSNIRINLLPYHKSENDTNNSSTGERMQFFRHNLIISGVSASIRKSRGLDIAAACGQLASGLK